MVEREVKWLVVRRFVPGEDKVDLTAFGVANFSALKKLGTEEANTMSFQLDTDTRLQFMNAHKSDFSASDFIL